MTLADVIERNLDGQAIHDIDLAFSPAAPAAAIPHCRFWRRGWKNSHFVCDRGQIVDRKTPFRGIRRKRPAFPVPITGANAESFVRAVDIPAGVATDYQDRYRADSTATWSSALAAREDFVAR